MLIKTYKGKYISQPHFFILNKGNNCGKPLTGACANCFVFLADTEEEKEFYYWLSYALWHGARFHPYLVGSVIPFIHIKDVKDIISNAAAEVNQKPAQYQRALNTLIEIEKLTKAYLTQLKLVKSAKQLVLNKVLR